jgi:hypothetical protein
MEALVSEEDDKPLDLSAWEPQLPPSDFAARVMAKVHPPQKRRRWPFVAALASTAIAAAVLIGIAAQPPSKGEAIAKDRTEIPLGHRAIAVLEPGANVRWNADDVVQSQGDVFYRVERGARFTVHTPAGDVEVKGTCFSVKVREMNKRDLKIGVASTALSALAFVAVYEGSVSVSHAGERVELTAGQTAKTTADGVKRTSGETPADIEAALATADNADDDPQVAANRNLVRQIGEYRHRLDTLSNEKTDLEVKLKKSEDALSASKDGAPVNLKNDFDLGPDEWKELAKTGSIKYQNPCIDTKEPWKPSKDRLNKLGLAPDDGATLTSAYQRSSDRLWATIKPLCAAAVGSADVATRIGPDTCIRVVLDSEKDRDPAAFAASRRMVGKIRAGEAPMPAPNAELSPTVKLMLAMTGASKALEDDLAQSFGPEEAHRLVFSDQLCMGRHSMSYDDEK